MASASSSAGAGAGAGPSQSASACVRLLHEAEGHAVTLELRSGELYRGQLAAVEDSMNVQLRGVTHTARDGRVSKLESVYIRGSQLRFAVLPDVLKAAPLFKKVQQFADLKAKPLPTGGRGGRGGRGRGGAGGGRGGRGGGRGGGAAAS